MDATLRSAIPLRLADALGCTVVEEQKGELGAGIRPVPDQNVPGEKRVGSRETFETQSPFDREVQRSFEAEAQQPFERESQSKEQIMSPGEGARQQSGYL